MREGIPTLTPALSLSEGEGAVSIPSPPFVCRISSGCDRLQDVPQDTIANAGLEAPRAHDIHFAVQQSLQINLQLRVVE
jgi:hypothetical protein